jgi:GAF domain-containing protein
MTEILRLAALQNTALLDSIPEERFDRLTRLASRALGTDIALISLLDKERQWFKSRQGLDVAETPRDQAFCDYAIESEEVMVVPDATQDPRFANNPLVTGDPNIAFYAGVPLITKEGRSA